VASEANIGAYMAGGAGGVQTFQYVHLQGTVYAIPALAIHVVAVLTNTVPIGVTRAPGFAEAVNIIERLIDAAARQCGFDPAALRRQNFAPSAPMTNAFGFAVDSGRFRETFDRALVRADLPGFPARRTDSERRGRLRGLGFAYHIKGTGGSPQENVDIRFEPDGTVSLITGTQTIGQGHETTFPQILSDRLGIPNALIRLRQGDTDLIPMGGGHGSSRATYMGGTAIWRAAAEIVGKGRPIAALALEAPESALDFSDGYYGVPGTNRSIGLIDVAARAREQGLTLDTYHAWTREAALRGGRLRCSGESDDRVRTGTWRDCAGCRPGAAGTRCVRRYVRTASGRLLHGLRAAAGGRPAGLRSVVPWLSLYDQPARREGRRRSSGRRHLPRHRQRDPGCAGAARRHGFRGAGNTVRHLAGNRARGRALNPAASFGHRDRIPERLRGVQGGTASPCPRPETAPTSRDSPAGWPRCRCAPAAA
jgi:hypothetical protein